MNPNLAPTIAPIPPVINTNAQQAGASFGRQGTRSHSNNTSAGGSVSQVSMVSINGQSNNGPVFDSNGNRIA